MSINKPVIVGEVLYIIPDRLTIMVVMTSEHGFRYVEPMNPQFDDNSNMITTYVSYETLSEWTTSFGSITNISATLMGKTL